MTRPFPARFLVLSSALGCGLLAICSPMHAQTGSIPDLMPAERPGDPPVWASSVAATGADGEIDWELLGEKAKASFDITLQNPAIAGPLRGGFRVPPDSAGVAEDGTVYYGMNADAEAVDVSTMTSLGQLLEKCWAVFSGSVVDVKAGFWQGGEVGALILIQPSDLLHAGPSLQRDLDDNILLFYPRAKLQIGSTTIIRQHADYPFYLAPGDRVMVFALRPAAEGEVLSPGDSLVAVDKTTGEVSTPQLSRHFHRSTEESGLGDLKYSVLREVNKSGAQPKRQQRWVVATYDDLLSASRNFYRSIYEPES